MLGPCTVAAWRAAHKGVQLALDQQRAGALRGHGLELDFVRVVRRLDRKFVTAAGHRHRGRRQQQDQAGTARRHSGTLH
jgi:hypothetical protein